MKCTTACVQPSPSNAHCAADGCHTTFGGITGFDRHRRDGQCLTPDTIGYTSDSNGVYRAPLPEAGRARLAALRAPQTAENDSGVPEARVGAPEAAETISEGSA